MPGAVGGEGLEPGVEVGGDKEGVVVAEEDEARTETEGVGVGADEKIKRGFVSQALEEVDF